MIRSAALCALIAAAASPGSSIPAAACLKLRVNAGEQETLVEYLQFLAGDRARRLNIGESAAAHIRNHQSLATVVRQYLDILADT